MKNYDDYLLYALAGVLGLGAGVIVGLLVYVLVA
jgi:hypothetical protein